MSIFGKEDFSLRTLELKKQKITQLQSKSIKTSSNHHRAQKKMPEKQKGINQALNASKMKESKAEKEGRKWQIYTEEVLNKEVESVQKRNTGGYQVHEIQQRLKEVEEAKQQQAQSLWKLNREISMLKMQQSILKAVDTEIMSSGLDLSSLQRQHNSLQHNAKQMEAYLLQYGVYWQGTSLEGSFDFNGVKQDIQQGESIVIKAHTFDLEVIVQRINELNQCLLEEHGTHQVVSKQGVHSLQQSQELDVIFYEDGLQLGKQFGFHLYQSKTGRKILLDLSDGYYPSLFRQKYPQGVIMRPVNHFDRPFVPYQSQTITNKQSKWFSGSGIQI